LWFKTVQHTVQITMTIVWRVIFNQYRTWKLDMVEHRTWKNDEFLGNTNVLHTAYQLAQVNDMIGYITILSELLYQPQTFLFTFR